MLKMKKYYKQIGNQTIFFEGTLTVGNMQIINPTEEQLLENGWQIWTEPIQPEPTEEELLLEAKREKIEEIINHDQSSAVNSFSISGQDMWLDAPTRQQLRISVMAYQSLGKENVSKWFNGNEYTFTTSQWLDMLDVLEVYASEALNVTEQHKAAIEAFDNITDVTQYDITTDYPEKIAF